MKNGDIENAKGKILFHYVEIETYRNLKSGKLWASGAQSKIWRKDFLFEK